MQSELVLLRRTEEWVHEAQAQASRCTTPLILQLSICLIVPVFVVPVSPGKIRSHLVILLCIFYNLHVEIHDSHTFSAASQSGESAGVRDADLRQASVAFAWWTSSVREDDSCRHCQCLHSLHGHGVALTTGVLETSGSEHAVQEQALRRRIDRQAFFRTILTRSVCAQGSICLLSLTLRVQKVGMIMTSVE